MTFFTSSFNSGTLHLQIFAIPIFEDYFLQRIIYIFFATNGLKNLYIYKIKFPVNNKIYFPVFTFFIYILYNNIIDHEIINIYISRYVQEINCR